MQEFLKYFNEIVLPLFVALAGMIVYFMRKKKKEAIRLIYNPNDERVIEKVKSEKKEVKDE